MSHNLEGYVRGDCPTELSNLRLSNRCNNPSLLMDMFHFQLLSISLGSVIDLSLEAMFERKPQSIVDSSLETIFE